MPAGAVRQKGHTAANIAIAPIGSGYRNSHRNVRGRPRTDGADDDAMRGTSLELAATSMQTCWIGIERRSMLAASHGGLRSMWIIVGERRAESALAVRRAPAAAAGFYFQSLASEESPTDRTCSRPAAIADVAPFKASEISPA